MTIEADLVAAVTTLVAGRVYFEQAKTPPARPYIVIQQAGGVAPTFVERAEPSKKNGRFQFSVWHSTRGEAAAVALQIETRMVMATAFDAKPLGAPVALYDEETDLRGTTQDFSVWSNR